VQRIQAVDRAVVLLKAVAASSTPADRAGTGPALRQKVAP